MSFKTTIPKLKRIEPKGKITVYPSKDIEVLYYIGKGNGHDTTRLVREVVERVLLENAEALQRPAV
jgi:hypothetical protein